MASILSVMRSLVFSRAQKHCSEQFKNSRYLNNHSNMRFKNLIVSLERTFLSPDEVTN